MSVYPYLFSCLAALVALVLSQLRKEQGQLEPFRRGQLSGEQLFAPILIEGILSIGGEGSPCNLILPDLKAKQTLAYIELSIGNRSYISVNEDIKVIRDNKIFRFRKGTRRPLYHMDELCLGSYRLLFEELG